MLNLFLIFIQPRLELKFEYVFYILGIMIYILGIFLSSRPVFINPTSIKRIKGDDGHDDIVYLTFFLGNFCISIPSLLNIFNNSLLFISMFWGLFIINFLLIERLKVMKKQRFLRPIHCKNCRQKLRLLDNSLIDDFLNRKEIIARRIKSIYFEVWHCQKCYPTIERNSTHLRLYISLSDKFKCCQHCNELTMTKTYTKVLHEATTTEEGRMLFVYTCDFCDRQEQEIRIIPRINNSGDGIDGVD